MPRRFLTLTGVLTIAVAAGLAAQTSSVAWTQPRTPWGDPDLQGIWPSSNMLQTAFERDTLFGTRAVLNDEEYAQRVARAKAFLESNESPRATTKDVQVGSGWLEYGRPTRQASLVVDPPDGRIPPLTPEAQKREAGRLAQLYALSVYGRGGLPANAREVLRRFWEVLGRVTEQPLSA